MDWLFADNDDEEFPFYRRPYNLPVRATINEWDDINFLRRFRLTKPTFMTVLQLVEPALRYQNPRPRYVTPEQPLLITLRFLASGNMQITVADVIRVSQATVSRILPKVCMAIIAHINTYLKMPQTEEERKEAAREFFQFANFPRTIGVIDCTHVKVQSPGGQLSEGYRNRKGYFSLNVQTISSADLKVMNVVARWPGSAHDQTIFRHSLIRDRFEAGEFGRYILVGDSGYANTKYLATPYTANNQEIAGNVLMQVYQAAIIRTRNVVERQYGILKRRFPALAYGMRIRISSAQKIITAATILHNICIDAHEPTPPMDIDDGEFERIMMIDLEMREEYEIPQEIRNENASCDG